MLRKCAQAAKAGAHSNVPLTEVCNRLVASPAVVNSIRYNATSASAGPGKQAVSNALLVDTLDMVSVAVHCKRLLMTVRDTALWLSMCMHVVIQCCA